MGYDAFGNSTGFDDVPVTPIAVQAAPQAVAPAATAATPAQLSAREKIIADFTDALDVGFWEKTQATLIHGAWGNSEMTADQKVASAILNNRTPDQIMDAFAKAKPEWKPVVDEIKTHPETAEALKNALVKDPTMIEGLADMAGEAGTKPEDLVSSLQDPQSRHAMTFLLNKVADDKDRTYEDFKRIWEKRDNKEEVLKDLTSMGYKPEMGAGNILAMVKQFFQDPVGFMRKLPELMGLQGEQADFVRGITEKVGMGVELAIGGDEDKAGYRYLFNKYAPAVQGYVQEGVRVFSQEPTAAAPAAEADPTTTVSSAEPLKPSEQKVADNIANGNRYSDLPATSVSLKTEGTRMAFGTSADPVQPERQVAAIEPLKPQNNNIPSLSMAS